MPARKPSQLRKTLEAYYWLAKPGIIYGNLLAAAAGLFVAYRDGGIDWALFVETIFGIALVIGSACAFNNYIDRRIDKVMKRTSWRALASGTIKPAHALIFASLLGILGFAILAIFTNLVTLILGVIGFVDYIALYGWSKRKSWHGTLVGSISGSVPLAGGYTAVTGRFDAGALLLFLIMACWQMPHFYAIAIRRLKDYKAAGIPVLPAVKSIRATKIQMITYIAGFIVCDILLYVLGYVGWFCALVLGTYGVLWLAEGIKSLSAPAVSASDDDQAWAKKMFLYSLVFLPLFCLLALLDVWPL